MATDGLYKPPRAEPGAPQTTLGTLCAGDAPDRPTAPSTTCHRDSRTPKPPKAAASRRLSYWSKEGGRGGRLGGPAGWQKG